VLDAYASGTEAFKEITRRYGLTPDMIDNVMTDVNEVSVTVAPCTVYNRRCCVSGMCRPIDLSRMSPKVLSFKCYLDS